ncbi:MAG: trypsin-like serine peptidase [Solirubrobacterales bacterium]
MPLRLAPLLCLLTLLTVPSAVAAVPRSRAPGGTLAGASGEAAAARRVLRYWTPARMASARPLDLVVDRGGDAAIRPGRASPTAAASFRAFGAPDEPPYSVNGRIFVKQGSLRGYCSGTAIDSPTRQLVLTAGHCVNNGHEGGRATWFQYLEFVPAFTAGQAPFGAFVAQPGAVYAPRPWSRHGNSDFDLGAFLTQPNELGLNVADAVGGGATIALDLPRHQRFRTFGYPGNVKRLQGCDSPYTGDDRLSFPLPGPPTLGIRCHWAPGASGGGWLIGDGTEINGLNSYLYLGNTSHTYGPYFSQETVGGLVEGL